MLRVIFRYKLEDKTNLEKLRNSIKIFSVNQMVCYHVLLEAFNVVNNGSSDIIQKKWRPNEPRNYPMRRERKVEVKVNVPAHVSCQGFTREPGNQLPVEIQEIKLPRNVKVRVFKVRG